MVGVSFINPLSSDGRDKVRAQGTMESFLDDNNQLIDIITRSISQDISEDSDIPHNFIELALKRIEWYLKKKNDPDFNYKKYFFLLNPAIEDYDVISFFLLAQAIGVQHGPNSREARLLVDSQGSLIQNRLEEIHPVDRDEVVNRALLELLDQENVRWTFFEDLLSSRKLQLSSLMLDKGNVIMSENEFISRFGPLITQRDPHKMYQLLIGTELQELILRRMVMQQTEKYISQVQEKARIMVEPNPVLLELGERLQKLLKESMQTFYGGTGGSSNIDASPLNRDAFPPCVKEALEGIKSGGRNDAIVLFMTPFVSYARLCPDIFKQNMSVRISDKDSSLDIVQNEVLPLIYEAAERCSPPLFEDQPQEKININAKLGFGMHETLKKENEGETKWYTPMSCEKVKLHLPHLCHPDVDCKNIGNPLTYYNRKKWILNQNKSSKMVNITPDNGAED